MAARLRCCFTVGGAHGVPETLTVLKRHGVLLAVVSDTALTLAQKLKLFELDGAREAGVATIAFNGKGLRADVAIARFADLLGVIGA